MKKEKFLKGAKTTTIIAVIAALLWFASPSTINSTYVYGQGGYGDYESPPPTTGGGTGGVTTSGGVFTKDTTFKSADGNVIIEIPRGTVGKTKGGDPLPEVRITEKRAPQAPPEDMGFIGLSFDLRPDGATFNPPISVTFVYDLDWLPPGLGPESLSVWYYDEGSGQWVMLDAENITIDPATNSITAEISHFTVFSVMAYTAPADFTISDLTISPTTIEVAEQATISAVVANSGDVSGTTEVTLKINGVDLGSKRVTLAGHESTTVSFATVQGKPGNYTVDMNGLSGSFTVKAVPIAPVTITSTVPSVTVPPVEYPAPTAPVPPVVPAPVPAPMPWLTIIIALAASVIVAVILIWYYGFRSTY